jgi:hypothetical protein
MCEVPPEAGRLLNPRAGHLSPVRATAGLKQSLTTRSISLSNCIAMKAVRLSTWARLRALPTIERKREAGRAIDGVVFFHEHLYFRLLQQPAQPVVPKVRRDR